MDPDPRSWDEPITGEGEDGSAESLHSREANKLNNNEAANSEKYTTCPSETIVVDLSDWLSERAGKNFRGVTLQGHQLVYESSRNSRGIWIGYSTYHAEAQDNVE